MGNSKIKWAPKIRQEKILKLYQSEKIGIADEILIADVGIILWLRCKSILMVYSREVECPKCGHQFKVDRQVTGHESDTTKYPSINCDWETTALDYQNSWSNRQLNGTNALPAFQNFFDNFLKAKLFSDKMVLIDQLLHSFHWDLKMNLISRSVMNNLVEGSYDQVVEFLDQITYDGSNTKEEWRNNVDKMWKRRRGSQ